MIGIWHEYAAIYLIVAGIGTLVGYGVPLLVAPIAWARRFRWEIPSDVQLVTCLGRTLGIFACVIGVFAIKAAGTPQAQPFYFELMLWAFVGMILLHIYGAIKRIQPATETWEIGLWAILFLLTLAFFPVG